MLIIAMLGQASRQDIVDEWKKRGHVLRHRHLDKVLRFLIDFGVIEVGKDKLYQVKSGYLYNAIINEEPESLLDDLLDGAAEMGGANYA